MNENSKLIYSMEHANLTNYFYRSDIARGTDYYENKYISYVYSPRHEEALFCFKDGTVTHFYLRRAIISSECTCDKDSSCKHVIASYIYVKRNPIVISKLCAVEDQVTKSEEPNVDEILAYLSRLIGPFNQLNKYVKTDFNYYLRKILAHSDSLFFEEIFKVIALLSRVVSQEQIVSEESSNSMLINNIGDNSEYADYIINLFDKVFSSKINYARVIEQFISAVEKTKSKQLIKSLGEYSLDNNIPYLNELVDKLTEKVLTFSDENDLLNELYIIKFNELLTSASDNEMLEFSYKHLDIPVIRQMTFTILYRNEKYDEIVKLYSIDEDEKITFIYLCALSDLNSSDLNEEVLYSIERFASVQWVETLITRKLIDESIMSELIELIDKIFVASDRMYLYEYFGLVDKVFIECCNKGIEEVYKNFDSFIANHFDDVIKYFQTKIIEKVTKTKRFTDIQKYIKALCSVTKSKFYAYDLMCYMLENKMFDYLEKQKAEIFFRKIFGW